MLTLADLIERETNRANAAADRAERCLDLHGYGCALAECGRRVVRPGDITGLDPALFVPTGYEPFKIKYRGGK